MLVFRGAPTNLHKNQAMNVGKHTFSSNKSHVVRTFWAQETSLSEEMFGCGNSQEASHAELRTLMTPGIH